MNRRAAATLLALSIAVAAPGCLHRRIRITSEPPGARAFLNDVEIGRTPVEASFKFYGVYDVRLELDGYEPLHEGREAGAPVWEWPGVDLAATVIPADFDHVVKWHFNLEPALETQLTEEELTTDLTTRAQALQAQLQSSNPS